MLQPSGRGFVFESGNVNLKIELRSSILSRPTELLTIFEPQNPPIDVSEAHLFRLAMDFEALNLEKNVQSGFVSSNSKGNYTYLEI